MESEHMRYLGCLGLLAECAVHVPTDLREMIEQAMDDACAADPGLTWRRVLNRIEVDAAPKCLVCGVHHRPMPCASAILSR